MMRSLYSAVSGLKTHQTRMDVIGNNIANVNTEAFKASRVTFTEIMYQTTSNASAGNGAVGVGGKNAMQIGLGVAAGATNISITTAGAAETTGNPFDLKLTDSQTTNFFIVSDGVNNFFTRSGSYYVDGNGYLCMTSTGYTLMGWQVDPTTGEIRKDTVSSLQVMSPKNQTSAPEATTNGYVSGVLDKNDSNVNSEDGYIMTMGFYDDLGYSYTAKFSVKPKSAADEDEGRYLVSLADVYDAEGVSLFEKTDLSPDDIFSTGTYLTAKDENGEDLTDEDGNVIFTDLDGNQLSRLLDEQGNQVTETYYYTDSLGRKILMTDEQIENVYTDEATGFLMYDMVDDAGTITSILVNTDEKTTEPFYVYQAQDVNGNDVTVISEIGKEAFELVFDNNKGTFISINGQDAVMLNMSEFKSETLDAEGRDSNFKDISVDFSTCLNYENGGVSTMKSLKGTITGDGAGKKLGALTGVSVDNSGKVYGSYDNGNTVLLCQVSVAQFGNASGLEKIGDNCYRTTLNSGEFDGIGTEITADGSSISTGELEMSNVDLSAQFTDMIITQRGFQANSKVITTSDSLLEELINLKR
ncbi:MAG: flagellar hook-basal body complex protein [Lachnospiraceae bacterium]|nr:flagellar hook-basal body complex protein [Lachnospiraceae bacterium]